MSVYLVHVIYVFMPLSMLTGLFVYFQGGGKQNWMNAVWGVVFGILSGSISYILSVDKYLNLGIKAVLYGIVLVYIVMLSIVCIFQPEALKKTGRALLTVLLFLIAFLDSLLVLPRLFDQGLSPASVVNTELILNAGSIVSGLMLMAFIPPLIWRLGLTAGRNAMLTALLAVTIPGMILWASEWLLTMMRLEMIEVTRLALSFVARAVDSARWQPYYLIVLLGLLGLVQFKKAAVCFRYSNIKTSSAQRRKRMSKTRRESRWFKLAVATVLATLSPLLYYDLYASRPPTITPPIFLRPDADGVIRVKVDAVKDGNLHRFAYVTQNGHVVRFFMINRYPDNVNIGVVYDACMLCGDVGYIQDGNDIICIACGVKIFIPSIGRSGGCNPIPFESEVKDGTILVKAAVLEKGKQYFSEILPIKVINPVNGEELMNIDAEFQYDFKGKTYFFNSRKSWDQFKVSPESYL